VDVWNPKLERAGRSWLFKIQSQLEMKDDIMTRDDRDILVLLKDELAFIEQGGYGRSVRTPWLPKSAFEDSLTCINFGDQHRARPCNECHLIEFVANEHHPEKVPCHLIALNEAGDTIEDLEAQGNQAKLEATLKHWMLAKIKQIEDERTTGEPSEFAIA
jgi:hypothetical protein